jgi:hypothetical protein
MSLRSGKEKPATLRNASWEKVLSPLIARKTAPRSVSFSAA